MFSKLTSTSIALLLAIHAHGHALISPDLTGGTARGDVGRPSKAKPCGANVDIASLIDTAQAVPVTNGNIDATITNFNGGKDGSRFVTAQIDPTGTGENFVDATVTTNGDEAPTDVGSQPLVVQVPAGTTATGGTAGNRMLVAFKTAGGFGNCIAATTDAAAASSNTTTTAASNNTTTTAASNNTTTTSAADTGAAATGNEKTTEAKGAGAAKAAAGGKKAKGKKAKAKGAKAKAGKAGAGAGAQKAAKTAKKHRDMQKLRLRNAVAELISNSSE